MPRRAPPRPQQEFSAQVEEADPLTAQEVAWWGLALPRAAEAEFARRAIQLHAVHGGLSQRHLSVLPARRSALDGEATHGDAEQAPLAG